MQHLEWNDFQAFLAVARSGQFAKAAIGMGVDPTTIGRRLQRLEARLGTTLFERTREGQILTEAGEALLSSVEEMARTASSIAVGQDAGGLSGSLRISVSEGFGSWFLTRHIDAFVSLHPHLTFDLVANSGFLSPSKREADIAVLLSRPSAGPLIAGKLSDYTLRLYANPAYLEKHGAPQKPDELAVGHRLVGYIPDLLYAPELNYFNEILPGLSATIRSSSINAQLRLIVDGAGIGVLPCFMGDSNPELLALLPERQIRRSFWVVTHKDTHNLARVRAGKEWLLAVVEKHRDFLMPDTTRR
jgi:DNA-binding transcriptional LysR family regulator